MTKKTLDGIAAIGNIFAAENPNLAPFAKGIQAVIESSEAELEKPETWEGFKLTVIMIMGFIPAAIPFIAPVSVVFDVIIASLKAEKED